MHAVKHHIKHAHTASLSLRYRRWLIPAVFLLKWMLNCSILTQSLMQKYIDNPDLFVHLLKMALCHPRWADSRINVILFRGEKKRIQQTPSLLAMWACVSVWALWKWNWKSPKKKEKWWRVKEKWSQIRIKQGWNKTRTNGEQIRVEHQMVKKNKRHSPCKNQEEKGFHSLLSTAHSRGGKAVYSFSNASVSVDVCVWVYWAKNRVVIEK